MNWFKPEIIKFEDLEVLEPMMYVASSSGHSEKTTNICVSRALAAVADSGFARGNQVLVLQGSRGVALDFHVTGYSRVIEP